MISLSIFDAVRTFVPRSATAPQPANDKERAEVAARRRA